MLCNRRQDLYQDLWTGRDCHVGVATAILLNYGNDLICKPSAIMGQIRQNYLSATHAFLNFNLKSKSQKGC